MAGAKGFDARTKAEFLLDSLAQVFAFFRN